MIRLLDRQGILKGDLNIIQRFGLNWLMNAEIDEQIDLEKFRALNTALGANQATSGEFIKKMIDDQQPQIIYETDESWRTPENVEEIEKMFQSL